MRLNKINVVFLHKISCTRQFENKFSLRSFALSLHKISCTRQFENSFHCAHLHYLCKNRKQNKDIKYD